jgi:hypothetical protein
MPTVQQQTGCCSWQLPLPGPLIGKLHWVIHKNACIMSYQQARRAAHACGHGWHVLETVVSTHASLGAAEWM